MMMTPRVVMLLILALSAPVAAGQRQAPTPEQIQRMKDIYLPSAPHAVLARLAGEWDQEIDFASGTSVERVVGRVRNRMAIGGRFLISEGDARKPGGGLDLTSMLVFGFDGRTREHTAVVFDSFGTYYVTAAGAAPAEGGGPIVMRGETMEGAGTKKYDVVLRVTGEDSYAVQVIFHLPGRDPVVALSATYRRVR